MTDVLIAFLPAMLAGFLVNLYVAAVAVGLGFLGGVPLALLRLRVPWTIRILRPLIMLMQAAPVYVIMFFLMNMMPRQLYLFGQMVPVTALTALILSQAVNMVAYVSENAYPALVHLRRHQLPQAVLFLPNIMRGFIVVVMSSGLGAAIGVPEAVGVTLAHAQRLPVLSDRVVLFLVVMAFFVTVFGTVNLILRLVVNRVSSW